MDSAIYPRQTIPTSRPPRIGQRSAPRSAAAGHASSICRPNLDPLVSRRARCRTRTPQAVHVSRTRPRERYLLVPRSGARTPAAGYRPADPAGGAAMISSSFPSLLQSFFTDRLLRQRQSSLPTIAGYLDCFRILLPVATKHVRKTPPPIP